MSTPANDDRGELAFIRHVRTLIEGSAPAPGRAPSAVPFGDDMASLGLGEAGLLWTVDMLMDGVDFDSREHSWHAIGRKALAVNLSDCAAMAARPVAALCALSLSHSLTMQDALELMRGTQECGEEYGCPIVGGDTNSWDAPTVISITVAAQVPPGREPIRRDGARAGDRIWLTGPVGGSILGRHLTFTPRVETALELAAALRLRAMIDISDGLALDLGRILEASGCGAVLDAARLDAAIHPDAVRLADRDGQPARTHALHDGEDFELIVVLPAEVSASDCARWNLLPIGQMTAEAGLRLALPNGGDELIPLRGWEHFR